MSRPVIAISAYREQAKWGVWDQPAVLIPAGYVDKVTDAGGLPVVIPPTSALDAQILDRVDGLLLAGGADLEPSLYGEAPHAETVGWRPDRDAGELALLDGALQRDLPVLGICRGLQIMTVHGEGRLEQHLPDLVGHDEHRPRPGMYGVHEVALVRGSTTHGVLGDTVSVKSYHHQGVADPGSLTIAGRAPDNTIEAVEIPGRRFAVGVLWHPEAGDDPRLFDALVDAAAAAAQSR
jgi:putative glutamine amidotransferase